MKKLFIFLAVVTCFRTAGHGQGMQTYESLSMYSKILKQEVKYSICLPEGYQKNTKRYPAVYLLHGLGDNESSWLEYGQVSQVAGKAIKNADIIPMIYVMPQGFRTYYVNDYAGTFLYQDMFVKELIPFIDSVYRTIANKSNRATMGYSMGGFGALVLPLKYPELFSVCVPMSISIRTDEQYMEEDSNGWDEQWGRLFGAVGEKGKDRITDYYQQNSPIPMIALQNKNKWKDLQIYIDNGDDEETLAFSNEVLHQLLSQKEIPHEYRVRNGGHEFSYWRQSLAEGLRFISDKFQGRKYRGDLDTTTARLKKSTDHLLTKIVLGNNVYQAYFPREYKSGNRLYPVIYVMGDETIARQNLLTNTANTNIESNLLAPFIMVFLPANAQQLPETIIPLMETKYRARPGFRFRSLFLVGNGGQALTNALKPEQFTSCAMLDASFDYEMIKKSIDSIKVKSIERTWYFIATNDKSNNSFANGNLHMLFRSKNIYHEYRVAGSAENKKNEVIILNELFQFTLKKMHR